MASLHFRVRGMDCGECAVRLEHRLIRDPAVSKCTVSAVTNIAVVETKDGVDSKSLPPRLCSAAKECGFPMELMEGGEGHEGVIVFDVDCSDTSASGPAALSMLDQVQGLRVCN
jgi:cation transport ATPase